MQGQFQISWTVFDHALVKVFKQQPEPPSPPPVPHLWLCSPQVTVRYNTIMTRNNKLREETVSMQIQKAIYDNSYWKMDERLVRQNRLLNAAIEQATEDYEQWYVALSALWAKLGAEGCQQGVFK